MESLQMGLTEPRDYCHQHRQNDSNFYGWKISSLIFLDDSFHSRTFVLD
jgi:hypothetical protein